MFKVRGKQQYGAVWLAGRCAACFNRGVALVHDENIARQLAAMGYEVDPEPLAKEPEPPQEPPAKEPEKKAKGK